jgi:GT2 family glycosyltransferase
MTEATSGQQAPEADEQPPARPPRVCSIIIPVHNKASLTRQCLNSLLGERDSLVQREIIVVDDGSSDLTPELLRAYDRQIAVVRNDTAIGFAGACNAGAAIATGDYIVFLNNDTIPQPLWLDRMVEYIEERPKCAMVGSKLLFPNDTIQHCGVVFGLDRYPHHIYAGFPADHPAAGVSRQMPAVTAACCLIRKDVWLEMGGFDRAFLNGWEDVDLCLRIGRAGYQIHYCAESVVYHFESTSRDLRSPRERENRQIFADRWRSLVRPDDFRYYYDDGLIEMIYPSRYPMQMTIDPRLGLLRVGDSERQTDHLLFERSRQAAILLRNNIVLNVRVNEAEMRAQAAEARAASAEARAGSGGATTSEDATPAGSVPVNTGGQQQILGRVESPPREPGLVTDQMMPIAGWALSMAGILGVETYVDGIRAGTIEYGEERADVSALYPGFPDSARPGFVGAIPTADLPSGEHDLEIRIIGRDGKLARIGTKFEVDSTAFQTGRVIMRCDRPSPNITIAPRERLSIAGWAIAPTGIAAVSATLDDLPLEGLSYGALRPDVARSYPFYPNVDHSGFVATFPLDKYEPGEHALRIEAVAGDGKVGTIVIPFVLEVGAPDIGEVPHLTDKYPVWLEKNEPSGESLEALAATVTASTVLPSIDLIAPVTGGSPDQFQPFIDALIDQVYTNWRLLLPVSPEAGPELIEWAQGLIGVHPRIGVSVVNGATTFAQLANIGLTAVKADWIGIVHPDIRMHPWALAEIALDLHQHPDTDIIYTDEDKIDPLTGQRWDPFFKPDWSPELHLAKDYLGPAVLYRNTVLGRIGKLADDLPGAECYDLALRATETTRRVSHLARPAVSRPAKIGEPVPAHPEEGVSAAEALRRAMERRRVDATVEPGNQHGLWRVRHAIEGTPGVTIVMPSGGKMQFLRPCMDDLINRTTYPNLHILILDNSSGGEVASLVDELLPVFPNLTRVPVELQPFNFSALINKALPHITTEYSLLLNDDITVITPDWIESMLEYAQQPEIGVVGAKLLYPDGTIQHAGVTLGPYNGTGHAFKFFRGDNPGYFGLPDAVCNYLGVTFACALMKTSLLKTLGGLDEENLPIAFNDVDFCLRAFEAGYRNVYTPHAALVHHESVTKKVIAKPSEIGRLRTRWGRFIDHDPYYNPNLTRKGEDGGLRMD